MKKKIESKIKTFFGNKRAKKKKGRVSVLANFRFKISDYMNFPDRILRKPAFLKLRFRKDKLKKIKPILNRKNLKRLKISVLNRGFLKPGFRRSFISKAIALILVFTTVIYASIPSIYATSYIWTQSDFSTTDPAATAAHPANDSGWAKIYSKTQSVAGSATNIILNTISTAWQQSTWTDGTTSDNANFTSNLTNWTKYFSKDTYVNTTGGNITTDTLAGELTTHTDTTDTDFNAGTKGANVAVTGSGSGASVELCTYNHGGADWTPTNGDAWDLDSSANIGIAGTHCNIGTFTVAAGTTYVYGYNGSIYGKLNIFANTATITGTLSANGKGYAGGVNSAGQGPGGGRYISNTGSGGGYGGEGGRSGGAGDVVGGANYGSLTQPSDMGSGGGEGTTYGNNGGAGGGAIKLNISGMLTINNSITANGAAGSGTYAGGGSGGSVWINTGTISGTGTITANGGSSSDAAAGGAGGGGRIAIYYANTSDSRTVTAYTGTVGYQKGGAGTIYEKASTDTYGSLTVKNNSVSGANTPLLENHTFDSLNLLNKASLVMGSGYNLTINNSGAWTPTGNLTGVDNGIFSAPNVTNLTIPNAVTITYSNPTNFSTPSLTDMTIQSGGILTHLANTDTAAPWVANSWIDLSVSAPSLANLTIDSGGIISANGKGYAGGISTSGQQDGRGPGGGCGGSGDDQVNGGGYGGEGGDIGGGACTGIIKGLSYGSLTQVDDLGSGGGWGSGATRGGDGGGLIKLNISGTLTVNGTISANGSGPTPAGDRPSGGSGGGINIITGTFAGTTGTITANGAGVAAAGGGGGGRIAVYYTSKTYSETIYAYGSNSYRSGGAGTIYQKALADTYGSLQVDNNSVAGAVSSSITPINGAQSFKDVTVSGKAIVTHDSNTTAKTNYIDWTLSGNLTVAANSSINVNGNGYSANNGIDGGAGGCTLTTQGTGGGGHGGAGGNGGTGGCAGGSANDSTTEPAYLGSAGGSTNGGAGGGYIKITAVDATVEGTISANGSNGTTRGGGGAGGTVWLNLSGVFSGTTGAVTANGGTGGTTSAYGGGGGGGIVRITYGSKTYSGTATSTGGAAGGAGAGAGSDGFVLAYFPQTRYAFNEPGENNLAAQEKSITQKISFAPEEKEVSFAGAFNFVFGINTAQAAALNDTFISEAIDTSSPLNQWGTIAWNGYAPAGTTLKFQVAVSTNGTDYSAFRGPTDESDYYTSSGTDIATFNDNNRFLKYKAYLETSESFTDNPILYDASITYYPAGYVDGQTLTSSPFTLQDSESDGKLLSISWSETAPSGTDTKFQIATAPDNAGSPGTWTDFCGPDNGASGCATDTYFTNPGGGQTVDADIAFNTWIRYKIFFVSDGTATASADNISMSFIKNRSGNYISTPFDTSQSYNVPVQLKWTESLTFTSGSDLKFQIRTSPDNSSWTSYIGPDGTSGTYFSRSNGNCSKTLQVVTCTIPASLAVSDGYSDQWIQYKAFFESTNADMTPTISEARFSFDLNNAPVISVTSASQGSNGIITVNYNISDEEQTSANVYLLGNIGVTLNENLAASSDPGGGAVTVSSATNLPTSGTIQIGNEMITYTGKSGNDLTGATRAVNGTKYAAHSIGAAVWIKAATTGGNLGSITGISSTPSAKSATWTIKSDLNGLYFNGTFTVKISAVDGQAGNPCGSGDSSGFILDTKDPTGVNFVSIDHTTNTLTFATPSDDSSYQMMNSNYSDFHDATPQTFETPVTYNNLTSDPATVYHRIVDAYGNYADDSEVTPAKPQNLTYYDISNVSVNEYREFIAWGVISPLQVGAGFSAYKVYRNENGGDFSLIQTIGDRTINYLLDPDLSSDIEYCYKIRTEDIHGNTSAYSSQTCDTPNGQGGSDSTPPTITDVAVSDINTTSAKITWTTDELSDSSIGYSEDYTYLPERGVASMVTGHEVVLTGLDPDTTYHIKVKSRDGSPSNNQGAVCYGGEGCSPGSNNPEVFTFTTHPGPSISNVSAATSNYQATISWITSTNSNTYVIYSDAVSGGELVDPDEIGNPDPVGGGPTYNHSQTVTTYNDVALESGATYYFYVKSVDGSDNEAIDDNGGEFYSFLTTQDDDPPVIIGAVDAAIVNNTSAAIHWTTNEASTSIVDYGTEEGGPYTDTGSVLTYDSSHYVILSGLTPNTAYYYTVTSADINTNEYTSIEYSFTTLRNPEEQHDPLSEITDVSDPPSVVTDEKAVITFNTDQPAQCAVEYGTQTGNYTEVPVSESEYNEGHSIHLAGLIFSTTYYYQITCADNLDNTIESSEYSFATAEQQFGSGELDSTAPTINGVGAGTLTGESVTITWDTNENTDGWIQYGITSGTYENAAGDYLINSDAVNYATTHTVIINGLIPATKYYYVAISTDAAGNRTVSSESSFTTTSPSSISSITVTSTSLNEATVTWNTSVNMSSIVEYGLTTSYGEIKESSSMTKVHSVALSGLQSSQIYHLRVKGEDASNNLYASADYTFTPKSPPTISGISVSAITEHEVTVKFATNVPTDALISYTDPRDPKNSGSQGKPDLAIVHEVTLNNLASGTTFGYTIKARDLDGNETTTVTVQSFTTGKDEIPPKIENIKTDSALAQNDKVQTIISWTTDEPSDTSLIYKEGMTGEEKEYKVSDIPTTSHIAVVTVFKPGMVYHFNVKSIDLSGNSTTSADYVLLTPKRKENIIQIIIGNFQEIFGWAKLGN